MQVVQQPTITSGSRIGERVHLSFIGIPITPKQIERAFAEGNIRWVEDKIAEVDVRIEGLLRLRERLSGLVDVCRTGKKECRCPIVEAFEGSGKVKTPFALKGKG